MFHTVCNQVGIISESSQKLILQVTDAWLYDLPELDCLYTKSGVNKTVIWAMFF